MNQTIAPQQAHASNLRTVANNSAPSARASDQVQTQQAQTNQAQTNQASAEASALQMLASITTTADTNTERTGAVNESQIPEFAPAANGTEPTYVGTWSVSLPGNQAVQLALNADGSFRWTATKNGKSSQFEGQYRLENDRLTLVRSNDLQQMAGSWTTSGQGFSFKLDGATTGGLAFTRS